MILNFFKSPEDDYNYSRLVAEKGEKGVKYQVYLEEDVTKKKKAYTMDFDYDFDSEYEEEEQD